MRNLTDIIRPSSVEEAVALLQRETPRTVALAGGTALVGDGSPEVEVVIDLAALSLDYIRPNSQGLHLGAMTTLQELVDSEAVRGVAGGHVARAAHASTSNLLRRQATVRTVCPPQLSSSSPTRGTQYCRSIGWMGGRRTLASMRCGVATGYSAGEMSRTLVRVSERWYQPSFPEAPPAIRFYWRCRPCSPAR